MMTVSVAEIRKAVELVLNHVEETGRREFEVDADFYWEIPASKRYDPHNEPAEMTLGQLSFDLETLASVTNGKRSPLGWDLTWLASILRYMGEKSVG